jgi:2-amino-4-hydroxy-6-hydroxymethyldihydropteridine diphosphokinase
MARVYLGIGSNIDPEENLRLGIRELRRIFGEIRLSAVYASAAVGFEGADFLNMVVGLDSDESPRVIQDQVEIIHDLAGRERGAGKFASRPLDIDLLLYGDRVVDEPALKLPRCDVLDYSFVLRPLAELDPGLIHPQTGKTMIEHWQAFDAGSHPLRLVAVIL